ncbi:MAG: FtsX-like permease family protein [Kiritimatiellae bacterium]|nr:FtsX-like permease family protein [Kiritimatiellia bacterium]MDW8458190.1 FtsX-like permease family protein [Verrucomicrobiota bacterium]
MTAAGFVVRNAIRNKRRALLTVLSVAVSLFLFTTLQTALREMTNPAESDQSALRVITRHRVSLANVLPERYLHRIRQIDGVEAVTKFTWFGGIYQDERNFFPQFAVDPESIFKVFTEAKVDPLQLDAFLRERNAAVVGIKTMERFGWKLGDRITLRGTIWDCNPELVIRAVYRGGIDETNLMFHHDYFDELMGRLGITGTFWIRVRSPDVVQSVIDAIDQSFRNSEAETKTETERAFQLGFISMFGNIRMLIGSISTVIVFTIILVTASTMSMAIRERIREIAVLKALGFNGRHLFGFILAESFGLAMAGGLLGCVGAWALYSNIDIYTITRGFFIKFEVTPHILVSGLLIAGALGVISCVAPARAAIRTSVVAGLKELD